MSAEYGGVSSGCPICLRPDPLITTFPLRSQRMVETEIVVCLLADDLVRWAIAKAKAASLADVRTHFFAQRELD